MEKCIHLGRYKSDYFPPAHLLFQEADLFQVNKDQCYNRQSGWVPRIHRISIITSQVLVDAERIAAISLSSDSSLLTTKDAPACDALF
jgi:hypothetical protein